MSMHVRINTTIFMGTPIMKLGIKMISPNIAIKKAIGTEISKPTKTQ